MANRRGRRKDWLEQARNHEFVEEGIKDMKRINKKR